MRLKPFLLMLLTLCLLGCSGQVTLQEEIRNETLYQEPKPLTSLLPVIGDCEECWWKSDDAGPERTDELSLDQWLIGYARLTEETAAAIGKEYEFTDAQEPAFYQTLEPKLTGGTDFHWKSSPDFTKKLLSGDGNAFLTGSAWIDFDNRLIYFDLRIG